MSSLLPGGLGELSISIPINSPSCVGTWLSGSTLCCQRDQGGLIFSHLGPFVGSLVGTRSTATGAYLVLGDFLIRNLKTVNCLLG